MRNKKFIITLCLFIYTFLECTARSIPPPPGLPPEKLPIDGGIPIFIAIAIIMGLYFIAKKKKKSKQIANEIAAT